MNVVLSFYLQPFASNKQLKLGPFERSTLYNWKRIWRNVFNKNLTSSEQSLWYQVVNNVVPTNEALHKIGLTPDPKCRCCGQKNTIEHKLTDCVYKKLWEDAVHAISSFTRVKKEHINANNILKPSFYYGPKDQHIKTLKFFASVLTVVL